MTNKVKGAYYTPTALTDFMIKHIATGIKKKQVTILEPSVGDGAFIGSLKYFSEINKRAKFDFVGVERDKVEIEKAKLRSISANPSFTFNFLNNDFLLISNNLTNNFDVVIGNPPYIKKSLLEQEQIQLCTAIHDSALLSKKAIRNIWPSFLIRSTQLLNDNGILAMVLPADLLQVSFSGELRQFLKNEFQRLEIFTFDDLLFECKGQDTILVFGYKQSDESGQFYTNISHLDQLMKNEFKLIINAGLAETDTKWSHHYLSTDDLFFLEELRSKTKTMSHYVNSKPGVVTGANEFFIVDSKTESRYSLYNNTYPILQKATYVGKQINFTQSDYDRIYAEGKPSKLLALKSAVNTAGSILLKRYIAEGKESGLPEKHKCSIRNLWYVVPNVAKPAQAIFFKRSNHYPKLILNSAQVLVTDVGYMVSMKDGLDVKDLVFSFYNSLTFLFAELTGRFYGGGVLELTPKEFKNIPIPFMRCSDEQFADFVSAFGKGTTNNPTLNDKIILKDYFKLSDSEIQRIINIKNQLVLKRSTKTSGSSQISINESTSSLY